MVGKTWLAGLACVVGFFTLVAPAWARQARRTFYAGPLAGVAFPLGELDDVAKAGLAVGGTGDYMTTDHVAVGPDFVINILGAGAGTDEDVTLRFTEIGAHARGYFFSPVAPTNPYIQIGLGLYVVRLRVDDDSEFGAGGSDTKTGFNISSGIVFNAGGGLKLDIGGTIHIVSTAGSPSEFSNATVGLLIPFGD